MDQCTQCGAELGIGRFCTNCGHPVAATAASGSWRTDTAERPQVSAPSTFFTAVTETLPEATPEPPRHRGEDPRRGKGWAPWVMGFAVLALIALAGAWLLFGGNDDPVAAPEPPSASDGDRSPGRDRTPEDEPDPTPSDSAGSAEPTELAPSARVDAPASAPASQDSSGNTVRYVATHMLDGLEETTWRMPGDGTGESITFQLDSPAVLTRVGLINGYAKVGQDSGGLLDWYAGNRRIVEVEWSFDDGTVVTQSLRETAEMQTVSLRDVETASVTLRLLEVSAPGTGRASRDYTAISDVSILGAP